MDSTDRPNVKFRGPEPRFGDWVDLGTPGVAILRRQDGTALLVTTRAAFDVLDDVPEMPATRFRGERLDGNGNRAARRKAKALRRRGGP